MHYLPPCSLRLCGYCNGFGECEAFAAVEAVHKIFAKSWRQVEYGAYFPVSAEADETVIVLATLGYGSGLRAACFLLRQDASGHNQKERAVGKVHCAKAFQEMHTGRRDRNNMKIETALTDKGQIEYSVTGEGKPILFLHGGHSNCRETLFHKGFDSRRHQLVTPTRPGYGNTPLNGNRTPKKAAKLVVSLMDYLHIEKVVVYGISAGGLTSIELAAGYPERVEKLVLASAVSKKWLHPTDKTYKAARILFNPKFEGIVWGTVRTISALSPVLVANSFFPQFSKTERHRLAKEDAKELVAVFRNFSSKGGFLCDIDQDIDDSRLASISCSTLIVHSRNDSSVPFDHAQLANERIKNSTLLALNNEWGHLFWIGKDSQETIDHIFEFVDK